jgi:hypothetical protein
MKSMKILRCFNAVVPNLWYAYHCGYAADRLGVYENNIRNGGKHKNREVKIKTQKRSYEVLVYKRETYVKVFIIPGHQ